MMITTKGRNALKVMIDLAQHNDGTNISLTDIAERQHESSQVPRSGYGPAFGRAGLVLSARGKTAVTALPSPPKNAPWRNNRWRRRAPCARLLPVFRRALRKRRQLPFAAPVEGAGRGYNELFKFQKTF